MTTEIQSGLISRRTAFSLISAAVGVALPAAILPVSKAGAQTPGMERREDRREDRQDRREDRRDERRGVSEQPATTGSTAPTTGSTAPK